MKKIRTKRETIRQSTAKKNRRRGKSIQSKVCKLAGFKNTGVLGTEDGSHNFFSAEIKSCLKFVGQEFMEQCVRNAPAGKVPIVIVHVMGKKHKDDLVIFRFQDLPKILNKGISGTG